MPALAACFSTSLRLSITIIGRYGKPCWLIMTMLETSSAKLERMSEGIAKIAGMAAGTATSALQKLRL